MIIALSCALLLCVFVEGIALFAPMPFAFRAVMGLAAVALAALGIAAIKEELRERSEKRAAKRP